MSLMMKIFYHSNLLASPGPQFESREESEMSNNYDVHAHELPFKLSLNNTSHEAFEQISGIRSSTRVVSHLPPAFSLFPLYFSRLFSSVAFSSKPAFVRRRMFACKKGLLYTPAEPRMFAVFVGPTGVFPFSGRVP